MLVQYVVQETRASIIHANCLGGFRVFVNGVEIDRSQWKTKKAENLFKFLLINRHQLPKEKILEALWPESDLKSGDANLRMALTHVRKALGLDGETSESVILRRGVVYLDPKIKVHTDYQLFTAIAHQALEDSDTDNPLVFGLLEQAAGLYGGEFLPDDLYDDWSISLRSQLHRLYLRVLLGRVESYHRQGKLGPAIQACRHYLALEPADETVTRKAMEYCGRVGEDLRLYPFIKSW